MDELLIILEQKRKLYGLDDSSDDDYDDDHGVDICEFVEKMEILNQLI
jgi:hypothetical protein